jgi:hypothetical protein
MLRVLGRTEFLAFVRLLLGSASDRLCLRSPFQHPPPSYNRYHHEQFLYLKESFTPSPEERVGVLFDAFGAEGRLVVNYALSPAWG